MSKQRKRTKSASKDASRRSVPVAREVPTSIPKIRVRDEETWRRHTRKPSIPWAAVAMLGGTALLSAGILWKAGVIDPPGMVRGMLSDRAVAETPPSDPANFQPPQSDTDRDATAGSRKKQRPAVAESKPSPFDEVAEAAKPDGGAATAIEDLGSLDVSLLKGLEPKRIEEAGRFAGTVARVRTLAMSSDGRLLASGGEDGTIQLWDVASKQPLRKLQGHTLSVGCLSFSPDGSTLVSGSDDRTVRVWDVASGSETQKLSGHGGEVCDVAFAPDGRMVYAADNEGSLKQWEHATGREVRSLAGDAGFTTLAINPSGDVILVGDCEGRIRAWDGTSPDWTQPATSGSGLSDSPFAIETTSTNDGSSMDDGPFPEHVAGIVHLHIDAEGRVVSADQTGTAVLWNLATGEEVGRCTSEGTIVGCMPSAGSILTAHPQGAIRQWDSATESVTHQLIGHAGPVAAIARCASPGESLVTAGWDGTLRLWSLPKSNTLPSIGE